MSDAKIQTTDNKAREIVMYYVGNDGGIHSTLIEDLIADIAEALTDKDIEGAG